MSAMQLPPEVAAQMDLDTRAKIQEPRAKSQDARAKTQEPRHKTFR
ncbi:MAG: hypothetical protein LBN27_05155 [Prevotellaceae bacterium]|nr:hypothetical protein [Prevotellaceae bacterium]